MSINNFKAQTLLWNRLERLEFKNYSSRLDDFKITYYKRWSKKMYPNKKIATDAFTPRVTKPLYLFKKRVAGAEGLEPLATGFGERLVNLSWFNTLNTLRKYKGLRDKWLRYSQHIPAHVCMFLAFFVPEKLDYSPSGYWYSKIQTCTYFRNARQF